MKRWKSQIYTQADKHRKDSADSGNIVHGILDEYFKTGEIKDKEDIIVPVIEKIHVEFDYMWAESEVTFASKEGYGGSVDLVLDDGYIIDFKTKALEEITTKAIQDSHLMQLAAYRIGLDLPKARCYNLFISTIKPGELLLHEWAEEELERGWKMFKCLLKYWQLNSKYDSRF